jgi:hypothetical protein
MKTTMIVILLGAAALPACKLPAWAWESEEQPAPAGKKAPAAVMAEGEQRAAAESVMEAQLPRFTAIALARADMPYEKGQWVWAAVPTTPSLDRWIIARVVFRKAVDDHALVSGPSYALTPSAFVQPSPGETPAPEAGKPVLVHKGLDSPVGRVLEVTEDGLRIAFCAGDRAVEETFPPERVRLLGGKEPTLGAPVVYEEGGKKVIGRAVASTGEKTVVLGPDGKLVERVRSELGCVDLTKVYQPGAAVLVMRPSGAAAALEPARITEILSGGAGYVVETGGGETFTVCNGSLIEAGP